MCYGDIDHGRDGYYREWAEREEREREDESARTPKDEDGAHG